MSSVNWAKLAAQNRVKSVGIPWTPEEANAIYILKIPAEYVRKGIITIESYKKAEASGMEVSKGREDLEKEAKELGIVFTPEATAESLEKEIESRKNGKVENVRKTKVKVKKTK